MQDESESMPTIKSANLEVLKFAKKTLLSPTVVKGVLQITDLSTCLIELIGVDNFYCKSSTDGLKLMTANPVLQNFGTLSKN